MSEVREEACIIAEELGYLEVMPDIKSRIMAAKSEAEITRILVTARHMS